MSRKTLNESQVLRFKMLSGVDTLAEEKMREMEYSDDKMEEAAKPDFIDIDKDGDKRIAWGGVTWDPSLFLMDIEKLVEE